MIDACIDKTKVAFLKIPAVLFYLSFFQEGSLDFTTRNMRFSHHFQVSFDLIFFPLLILPSYH